MSYSHNYIRTDVQEARPLSSIVTILHFRYSYVVCCGTKKEVDVNRKIVFHSKNTITMKSLNCVWRLNGITHVDRL